MMEEKLLDTQQQYVDVCKSKDLELQKLDSSWQEKLSQG